MEKSIIQGLAQVAEIKRDGSLVFTHTDVLGSPILLTNAQGQVVGQYDYDPFGNLIGSDSTESTKYLFTGQEYDNESDLYYYNARYYNPVIGRFISRDPVLGRDGDSLSRNGYIYVKNNPLKYVDPSGEEEETMLQGFGAGNAALNKVKFTAPGTDYVWSTNPPPSYKAKSTSIIQLYKEANPNSVLRLDHGYNVKTGDVNYHWNQKGTFKDFGIVDHTVAGPSVEAIGGAAKALKSANKILLPVAVGLDAYSIYNADDKAREATRVAGGWGGAWAGAKVLGVTGAAVGSIVPGPGTAIGGFVGSLIGGIGGYSVGSEIATGVYDSVSEKNNTTLEVRHFEGGGYIVGGGW